MVYKGQKGERQNGRCVDREKTGQKVERGETDGHGADGCPAQRFFLYCNPSPVYGCEHYGTDHGCKSDWNDTGAGGHGGSISGMSRSVCSGKAGGFRRGRRGW